MTRRVNSNLAALLVAASTDDETWSNAFKSAMGPTRRIVCKRVSDGDAFQDTVYDTGTTFRDVALTGEMIVTQGLITSFGVAGNTTVATSANLLTGTSILRIEGNGNWVEGTLGLTPEAQVALGVLPENVKTYDFVFSVQPTANNGFGLNANFSLFRSGASPGGGSDRNMPYRVVLEDWSTGVAGTQQTIFFDNPQQDIVWQDAQLFAQTGPIPYCQSRDAFLHGDGGYRMELGIHRFRLPNSCNDEADEPVWQMLIAMTPKERSGWQYPEMTGFSGSADSTILKPCKIYVYKSNGELWHTFQMQRDNLPLNDPSMQQTRNATARWRPFINCAQMLYHCSHRLKESSDARKYYGGTVARYWHRPKICKSHGASNGTIAAFRTAGLQYNGYLHLLAMPKWSCNTSTTDYNADPKTDPNFPWTSSSNNPSGNETDGAKYPTHAVGWAYEYGACNTGHDFRHGPGGRRFERFAIPSQLAYYMTDPQGARVQGNVPWREIWDNYAAGFFNLSYHHVRNAKTLEMIPVSEAGYGQWGHWQGFYNYSYVPPTSTAKWINLHGLSNGEPWRPADYDMDGLLRYSGYTTDALHCYQTPGWHTTHFNSAAHAVSQKLRWFAMVMSWNKSGGHPSSNIYGATVASNQLFQRTMAWRFLQMAFVWKTAADHPLLVSRAEIEEIARLHLENIYNNVVVPTTDVNHPQYNHIFHQGLRNLGYPIEEIKSSTHHRYGTIDDDKKMYLIGVLGIMRTMGCFDRWRELSQKCADALDWIVSCYIKSGPERMVSTRLRSECRYVTQASLLDVPLVMPQNWAEVDLNMQPQDGSDMVRNGDGSQYVNLDTRIRERWLYQHLVQQCCYIIRDQFSDYNNPYAVQACEMSDEMEEFIHGKVTTVGSYEYNDRYIAAGPIVTINT